MASGHVSQQRGQFCLNPTPQALGGRQNSSRERPRCQPLNESGSSLQPVPKKSDFSCSALRFLRSKTLCSGTKSQAPLSSCHTAAETHLVEEASDARGGSLKPCAHHTHQRSPPRVLGVGKKLAVSRAGRPSSSPGFNATGMTDSRQTLHPLWSQDGPAPPEGSPELAPCMKT